MDNEQDQKKNEDEDANQPDDQAPDTIEVKTENTQTDTSDEQNEGSESTDTETPETDTAKEKKIEVSSDSSPADEDESGSDKDETKPDESSDDKEAGTLDESGGSDESDEIDETDDPDDTNSEPVDDESEAEPDDLAAAGAQTPAPIVDSVQPVKTTSSQMVFGKGSQVMRNLVIVVLALALIVAGIVAVQQLTKEDSVSTQTAVVKNEIPLLRVSAQEGPLNLFYTEVSNDGANMVNNHMYEGLVTYENINKIVPSLATSWTNPNDETWVFKLKENVKFHSGELMTAEDVKAALDNGNKVGQGNSGIDLKSVKVIDPNTIEVITNGPDPLLLGRLVGIWVTDDSAKVEKDQPPVGTGPYMVKPGSEPTANELTLVSFNDYHDGTVYTKELNIQVLSTTDAVKAFNEGKIDIASTLVSDSEDLNRPNQQLVTIKDFTVAFLSMVGSSRADSPLSKVEVRQAIAMTLDPKPIIEAQKVIGEPVNQFVTRDIPGFNTEIKDYEHNPEAAKKLLIEAGYPNGFSLSLSYASASNDGQFNSIKEQLASIGITVTKDAYGDDHDAFFTKLFSGTADLLFLAYSPEVLDASDTFSVMFGAESPISYSNAKVVELLDKAGKTLNESERLGILNQIGQELYDDVAAVPLYSRDSITAMAQPYAVVRHSPNGGSGFKFNQVYLP